MVRNLALASAACFLEFGHWLELAIVLFIRSCLANTPCAANLRPISMKVPFMTSHWDSQTEALRAHVALFRVANGRKVGALRIVAFLMAAAVLGLAKSVRAADNRAEALNRAMLLKVAKGRLQSASERAVDLHRSDDPRESRSHTPGARR